MIRLILVLSIALISTLFGGRLSLADSPTVIIFAERGFPYYGANQAVSPRAIADILRQIGVDARLVNTDDLLRGALQAEGARCLVWCYGNTFPRKAAEAIADFHRSGGSIVAAGVPFTHPCRREALKGRPVWRDEGHEDFGGHERIGVGRAGGFIPQEGVKMKPAPQAPFRLVGSREGDDLYAYRLPSGFGGCFCVGAQSLPQEDELIGVVGAFHQQTLNGYPVAVVKHHCKRFDKAIDVWAGGQWLSDPRDPAQALLLRQTLARGAASTLEASGALSHQQAAAVKRKLDDWASRKRLPPRRTLPFRPKSEPRLFPRSHAVDKNDTVLVCSAAGKNHALRTALACLQGLVNRKRPRLYLIYTKHDEQWLEWYRRRGYIGRVERTDDVDAIVKRFRASVKGAIIGDERFLNISTMLASVRDGIVCTPDMARRWSLPIIADVRGRWRGDAAAYRWAFDNLWPSMRHDVLCCGHRKRSPQQTDYLVAQRVFTFFISGGVDGSDEGRDPVEETLFAEELLAAAEPNTPVMGWWGWGDPAEGIGEYWGMTLASRYAKVTVGTEFFSNMSFHSGVEASEYMQQRQIDRLPSLPLKSDKVYVSLSVLDSGNDPWYWLRPQRDVWEAPGRGRVATGWIIGPALLDLAPGIAEWYYDHLTDQDELICALSGLGYMNVPDYGRAYEDRGAVLDEFLSLTAGYMRKLDLRTLQTYHGSWGERSDFSRSGDLALFAKRLPRLVALFPDVGRHETTTYADANYLLPGPHRGGTVPVFHCLTRWIPWTYSADLRDRTSDAEVAGLVEEVKKMTPEERPAFMSVFALSWTFRPEVINRAAQILGDEYVFVTPSQLAKLFQLARGEKR